MNPASLLHPYLEAIATALKAGNATEHTHRPALKTLLEAVGTQAGASRGKHAQGAVQATNEPQRIDCGAPDFIVTRGVLPLGYVEAKDVGVHLDKAAESAQLRRYRESLPNLILTDYIEFRWFVDGECQLSASLPRPGKDGKVRWNEAAAAEVAQLLLRFMQADMPVKATPHDLAVRMAGLGRLIRELITKTFEAEGARGELHAQLKAFRDVLMGDTLTPAQFADMYAQTLCYGLFAARCTLPAGGGFTRQSAAHQLPKTNPFLRNCSTRSPAPISTTALPGRWTNSLNCSRAPTWPPSSRVSGAPPGKKTRWCTFTKPFSAAYDPHARGAWRLLHA